MSDMHYTLGSDPTVFRPEVMATQSPEFMQLMQRNALRTM